MSGSVQGADYIKEQAIDFCKKQVLKEAMIKSVKLLKSSSYDEIQKIINDIVHISSRFIFHAEHHGDFEKMAKRSQRYVHNFYKLYETACSDSFSLELSDAMDPSNGFEHIVKFERSELKNLINHQTTY